MATVRKTLLGDADLIAKKIAHGIASFGNHIGKRDEWTTKEGGCRVIVQVYEKQGLGSADPDFCMTVILFDTGSEIRLYATTSGGWQNFQNNPYPTGEGELAGVLNVVLNVLDDIII